MNDVSLPDSLPMGWFEAGRIQVEISTTGRRCAPGEGVNVLLPRKQESPEIDSLVPAGLEQAQENEVIFQPPLAGQGRGVVTKICESPDRVLGRIVVPGHTIMFEEREESLPILQQSRSDRLRGFGRKTLIRKTQEELGHWARMSSQMPSPQTMFVDGGDDRP